MAQRSSGRRVGDECGVPAMAGMPGGCWVGGGVVAVTAGSALASCLLNECWAVGGGARSGLALVVICGAVLIECAGFGRLV